MWPEARNKLDGDYFVKVTPKPDVADSAKTGKVVTIKFTQDYAMVTELQVLYNAVIIDVGKLRFSTMWDPFCTHFWRVLFAPGKQRPFSILE